MTEAEFSELRADIAANGLRVPITLYEDAVLDGWHRYCACDQNGTEPQFTTFTGDWRAAIRFVVSANVARRHLSLDERADAAAAIANLKPGNSKAAPVPVSQSEAADLFGVSERVVRDAKVVAESGDEELKAQVKAGKVSRKRAAGTVRKKKAAAKAQERKAPLMPPVVVFGALVLEAWIPSAARR